MRILVSVVLALLLFAVRQTPAQSDPLFGGGQFMLTTSSADAASADVNLDGKMDLVTLRSPDLLYVSLGDGQGNLGAATSYSLPVTTVGFDVGDINGNSFPDVVAVRSSGLCDVLLNNGSGGFPGPVSSFILSASDVTLADVNGDAKLDIVAPSSGTTGTDTNVRVSLNLGSGTFGAVTSFSVGTGPTQAVVADFDLNGKVDIATANRTSNDVSLLLGNGIGGFTFGGTFAVGTTPRGLATADVNVDGRPDIVTANSGSDNASLLLGNASSTFLPPITIATGDEPYSVALADVNNDSKPDALFANSNSNDATVHLGFGTGGLGLASKFPLGQTPRSIFAKDMNGDGRFDILARNSGLSLVNASSSVLLGNLAGGFGAPSRLLVGTGPLFVAVADVNGDTHLDLVTADATAMLTVRLGNGAGGFTHADAYSTGLIGRYVSLGDLNLDTKPDAVVAHGFASTHVSVLMNDGSGAFVSPVTYSIGGSLSASEVHLARMDGNATLDLVTRNLGPDNSVAVTVLLNSGTGTFGAGMTPFNFVASSPVAMDVGDVNGDLLNDVVLANANTNSGVMLGNGAGGFSFQFVQPTGALDDIAITDLDENSVADLVGVVPSSGVNVVLGTGGGGFAAPVTYPMVPAPGPNFLAIGDIDGDGNLDVATANVDALPTFASSVACLLGNGSGALALVAGRFPIGTEAFNLAVADVTEDGRADILSPSGNTNEVFLHISGRGIDPWTNLGFALAGGSGEPTLTGDGTLEPSSREVLTLSNARPGGAAFLVVGLSTLYGAFKGGTMVPNPSPPGQTFGPFPVDGQGRFVIDTTWPGGPSGFRIYHQYWITDVAGPVGFSASNGLAATTP